MHTAFPSIRQFTVLRSQRRVRACLWRPTGRYATLTDEQRALYERVIALRSVTYGGWTKLSDMFQGRG